MFNLRQNATEGIYYKGLMQQDGPLAVRYIGNRLPAQLIKKMQREKSVCAPSFDEIKAAFEKHARERGLYGYR
jgi:hypothetical protein